MQNEKFNVNLYIRVSTDRQAKEGDSLEEQENELRKYCEFRRFQIRQTYIEQGKSAGSTKRPEYQKLVSDIKGKKINAVVVKKLDRLSRSILDFEQFVILLQKYNVEFISLKENFDTTSAMGKAMLRMALVFAQLEREQGAERVTDVMFYRAQKGQYNGGTVPFGYTNVNKELIPYPKERTIIELIFKKFIETKSTQETARFLNNTGYSTRKNKLWDMRPILYILRNPVYTGKVQFQGEVFQGIHQPIISEKQFEQIQAILNSKNRGIHSSRFRGFFQKLLFCGYCHQTISPTYAKNRSNERYDYYLCSKPKVPDTKSCKLKYLPLNKTDQKIIDYLLLLSEHKHFMPIENKLLKHNQEIEVAADKIREKINDLTKKTDLLKTKKDKYFDSLISGNFTSAEREKINKRIDEMELEGKQLKSALYKQEFELTQTLEDKIDILQLKQSFVIFKADYNLISQEKIREFILSLIEKVIIYEDHFEIFLKNISFPITFSK